MSVAVRALPDMMSGVVLTGHGGPDCLEWRDDLPVPKPGPRDVIVRVGATAVNNTDINTRLAWYSKSDGEAADASWSGAPIKFPLIQGIDGCGRIAAVGDGVDPGRIGERVLIEPCLREAGGAVLDPPWYLGSDCDGSFADYVCVAARHAFVVSSPLIDAELASFPCSYSTAENMLTRAGVAGGERVLVTGASGGVGSAAIQLIAARGGVPLAVTRSDKADDLRALGAAETLDREEDPVQRLGAESVDVVIDLVGGPAWPRLLDVLKRGGRYAVAGAVGGAEVSLDLRTLYLKDLSFFGCTALEPEVFPNLVKLIERGAIRPLLGHIFPLRELQEAQAAFLAKQHIGKIALTVEET